MSAKRAPTQPARAPTKWPASRSELLSDANLRVEDLAGLGVTVGPGSYTGVRIGLALARGLSLVDRIPVVGIGSLELLALARPRDDVRVCALLDAGARVILRRSLRSSGRRADRARGPANDRSAGAGRVPAMTRTPRVVVRCAAERNLAMRGRQIALGAGAARGTVGGDRARASRCGRRVSCRSRDAALRRGEQRASEPQQSRRCREAARVSR